MGMLSRAQASRPKSKSVEIPEGIFSALSEIAKMRDTSVELIIEMQMTGYVRAFERSQVFEPTDIMPYGKYKGYSVEDMIKVDPRYVHYMLSVSAIFRLSEASIELLNSLKGPEEDLFVYDEKAPKDINNG